MLLLYCKNVAAKHRVAVADNLRSSFVEQFCGCRCYRLQTLGYCKTYLGIVRSIDVQRYGREFESVNLGSRYNYLEVAGVAVKIEQTLTRSLYVCIQCVYCCRDHRTSRYREVEYAALQSRVECCRSLIDGNFV